MTIQHNFTTGTKVRTRVPGYGIATVIGPSKVQDAIRISTQDGRTSFVYADEITEVVSAPEPVSVVPSAAAFNVDLARLALEHERPINFFYADPAGKRTDRTVEVTDVVTTRKGATLIVGIDQEADDYRAFRVDRIDGEAELA